MHICVVMNVFVIFLEQQRIYYINKQMQNKNQSEKEAENKIESEKPIQQISELSDKIEKQSEQINNPDAQIEPIEVVPEQPENERFIEENPTLAQQLKGQGNNLFKQGSFQKAISIYQKALQYTPVQVKMRAILYSNIAVCLAKQKDLKDAADYYKKSIKIDPKYMKAHLNLADTLEKIDNPQQALAQYKLIVEMNPSDIKSQMKVKQLEQVVAELNEKRKKEVLDGLKGIGNSFLGLFGLSLDSFKMNQSEGGGYNISFKN